MKTIKTFNKKGNIKVELISDTFGLFVKLTKNGVTINCYWYDNMHEALNMFWYCVCMSSGIDKYIS